MRPFQVDTLTTAQFNRSTDAKFRHWQFRHCSIAKWQCPPSDWGHLAMDTLRNSTMLLNNCSIAKWQWGVRRRG